MIVLDTNILSETIRAVPQARPMKWLAEQPRASVFTTAITRGELLYGARLLPESQRKALLLEAIRAIFASDLAGRVLPFDNDAADAYAEIAASRKAAGRPISQFDAMIAAIVKSRGASLATRNVKDFIDCGIKVIDPWRS